MININGKTVQNTVVLHEDYGDGVHEAPDTLVIYFTDGTKVTVNANAAIHSRSFERWAEIAIT